MKKFAAKLVVIVSAAFFVIVPSLSAAEINAGTQASYEKDSAFRVAIAGFDPTLYFNESIPSIGDPDINYVFEGQVYHFVSLDNRDSFIADPGKYTPQYAGHCAFALAEPEPKVMLADPTLFSIDDGKLYLFSDADKLKRWNTNSRKFRIVANKRWEFEAKNIFGAKAKF